MMKLSYVGAGNIRTILLFLSKIISFPLFMLIALLSFIYIPFLQFENWVRSFLYWKLQGKSTDPKVRLDEYINRMNQEKSEVTER